MRTFRNHELSMKNKAFKIGAKIQWNWMGRIVVGRVEKIYSKPIKRVFRGTTFKRNGSKEKPAYLVKSSVGNRVLKLHSELSRADGAT